MSTFKEIKTITPYNENDSVLELSIDTANDSYFLENTISLVGVYTFSIWIKGNKNYVATFKILGTTKTANITTSWQKISYVVDVKDLTNRNIYIVPEVGTITYLYEGYLAQGNIDNSWLPAPEDTKENMSSIRSELIQKADSIEQKVTDSEGRITSLRTDLNGITGRVETAEGKITTVTATANGLTTKVQDAEKNISTLQQDSKTFTTEIANAKGDISNIRQDTNTISTSLETAKGDISQIKQDASALTSRVQTAEGDINTLTQTSGTLSSEIESAKGDISILKQQADGFVVQVGSAIKKTVEEFYLSTSPTALVGGTWSTAQPTWTQDKYIWRRTKVTYGNDKTDYTPSANGVCITGNTGADGKPGQNGSTGTSVSNMVPQFYLSDSKTEQIGGSWGTVMPTWSFGKYLWKRYQITYINPSSTEYTTPECDSSWEAIKEVDIGGRNLIKNSKTLLYSKYSLTNSLQVLSDDGAGNVTVTGVTLSGSSGNIFMNQQVLNDDGIGNVSIKI